MADERATVRPVTLARLVEATHACASASRSTADIEDTLEVTHRRARETLLEALRINIISENTTPEVPEYNTTNIGEQFLTAVRNENWNKVSDILATQSPHYEAFLDAVNSIAPADLSSVLDELKNIEKDTARSYNQTSVEVVGDWAERLGTIQRNAFTGDYYPVTHGEFPSDFSSAFLTIYDDLEETTGVSLRQRYLSVPELREKFCERHGCTRYAFDDALRQLADQNVGRLELSGAPIDTGAKEAQLGIKNIELGGSDSLVSTTQSTERVMSGIEQFGKQYYYLAVHDRDLSYNPEGDTTQL